MKRVIALVVLSSMLAGCAASRPDVAAQAARLSGIDGAIVFREHAAPFDPPPPADRTLTPERAIRIALSRDPRIESALAHVRVAEADANQARLLPNPILTIDIRWAIQPSNTAFEPSLTADLLSLLQKPAQISAADNRLRESAATALVTVLDVIDEVEEAFAAARSIGIEIDNARNRRQRLQKLRDMAQRRLDLGDATKLDVLTIDSQLMAAELEVSDLALQQNNERLTLNRLLGYARTDGEWELSPWQPPSESGLAAESAWVDAALANRPEIAAKVWELRALGEEMKGAALPPLSGGEMGAHGEHDPEWRLGPVVTVPLPLFDFGQAAREKIKAERMAARHDLAEAQLEVIQNVRSNYAAYLYARRALSDARNRLLPLQQQQLESAQRAYQSGDADLATMLLAQNDYETTLGKIVGLEEQVSVARAKLDRAVGGGGVAARLTVPQTQPSTLPATLPSNIPNAQEPPASQPATGPVQ